MDSGQVVVRPSSFHERGQGAASGQAGCTQAVPRVRRRFRGMILTGNRCTSCKGKFVYGSTEYAQER